MTKLRVTITAVFEYEPNPEHYGDNSTPEQMLAVDLKNAKDDPFMLLGSDATSWTTTGEVLK